jgi:hypothetical protein
LEEALEASLGPFPAGEGEEEAVGAAFWWFISRFEARFFTLF